MRTISITAIILFLSGLAYSQEQPEVEKFNLRAQKISTEIRIDGVLDELPWKTATTTSEFLNKWPDDQGIAKTQTRAWIMYDNENLYIGAVNYQNKEDLIVKSLKRDNTSYHWESDGFTVVLDPFNKKNNGFLFGVNAGGATLEGVVNIQNSRTMPDVNWDNVWYSSTRVYDEYWVAEIAIPFKSINYDSEVEYWGINFIRSDMKDNVFSTWSHVPQGFPGIDLGHLGTLEMEEDLVKSKQRIAVQPYMLTSANKNYADNLDPEGDFQMGLDAKIPLGSSMKMDLTVNPDFSTVDVDQQVTNLTRFSIFLPEKRNFFLENSDLFSNFGTWGIKPFFSRKIGIKDGDLVPILFGARMTGNVSKNTRVGVLNVQTRSIDDLNSSNYMVGAVQQNVLKRSDFKALVTNRMSFDGFNPQSGDFNRTLGGEFNYSSEDGQLTGNLRYHWSQTQDKLDESNFYGATLMYRDGTFFGGITGDHVGTNFINDLGYIQRLNHYDSAGDSLVRVGFNFINPWAGFTIRPDVEWINSMEFGTWTQASNTTEGEFIDRESALYYMLSTRDMGWLQLYARNSRIKLLFGTDLVGGDDLLPAKTYNYNTIGFNYGTDPRGMISGELEGSYGGFFDGTRFQFGGQLNVRAQPWGNFGVMYLGNRIELPGNYGEATLHLVGPRSEISFSNKLNWTTFLQYNTQSGNFNVNSRLQWRFASMSDIYLVYNDNYDTDTFDVKNRGLVFKINYWFN